MVEVECGVPSSDLEFVHNQRKLINFQETAFYYQIKEGDTIKIRKKIVPLEFQTQQAAQQTIEERIKQQNINESYQKAMEYHPENFAPVEMLYIRCHLNGHDIVAFIDTGAQKSVMSTKMAEKCE